MKKDGTNKKILYMGLAVLFIIFIAGIIWVNNKSITEEYNFPSPEKVVEQYFTSWNSKDYANMYAAFSDGFKKIDPNAGDLATFKSFASSQGIEGVNILSIKETSNDGETASVDYSVEFILSDGTSKKFNDKFTLKYRKGDVIQGWKLIHPYGENIDNS